MSFWEKVKIVLSYVWDFIQPAVTAVLKELGKEGLALIKEAVLAAEATGKTGTDKYKFAKEYAKDKLDDAGISVLEKTLNFALEAAVQKYT